MPCLGGARLVFNSLVPVSLSLCRPHSALRLSHLSYSSSTVTLTRWPLHRAFSVTAHLRNDLFNYTSGRWIINDALRHVERRRVFNVDGLRRLAAESVDRSPGDIVDLKKLAEGGFNRSFLITMRGGFQMVARIPYPVTVPKYFAVASEVATMALLRSSGLPIPEVYGYSPVPDNAAETEYIFMEFVEGPCLSDTWFDLGEGDIISITRQLAELESKMMSIAFPAGGSLYYTKDLEKVQRPGIPLEDERFCVGPDTRLPLWYGRRSQLDVDRGPYENAKAALVKGADKERAYLEQFGRPLLPFRRFRREGYQYQKQPPSDHIENLDRYLSIAPSLIPRDPTLCHFRIRHPDLQPSNIIVNSNMRVVGLIDWQHTSILPQFLLAGIPGRIQNYDDPVSQSMAQPLLPANLDDLDRESREKELELYRRRLVHYHYIKNTKKYNELHYAALADPVGMLRRRLFCYASDLWEGETLALKVALIDATENWETLTDGGPPCPVVFDAVDVCGTRKLDTEQTGADANLEVCENTVIGCGSEGWVTVEHYEEAMRRSRQLKEAMLAQAESEKDRAEIAAHWPFDDMDEEEYM
ncbi:protein kinase subdomain-containing protein PKL CAK Fmp29 [Coniophora puteana RWD-64-598 SS2]|uniref:Protein kinase subdomain-containing protein PKL CAK Fmp29 n=1 Tax=Coniophora puteana (strain RWD-64-598) TaxID=741705 RepID=A0A5M3MVF7_CONPW|nr:protein kinase subdomain-containing protein PKL CAK Fmp29 [Coniophora puteana RWD-64-598 SS2]EIW82704.1 protein kinase subdomain-containing protein PKL CAK Fmp29 [Coniophora puteana RWD-64-598 SS2]